MFLLPKPDDQHFMFILHLEPPLRQGQTRYPFLCFQIERDVEIEVDCEMPEEEWKAYEGKLERKYDAPLYEVVGEVFKGVSGKKVVGSEYAG